MKVIDLLNKIANGEDIKKFTYCGGIYEYNKVIDTYICKESNLWFEIKGKFLNDEIEIIEDTPKENKLINPIEVFTDDNGISYYLYNKYGTKCSLSTHDKVIVDKINEIIDRLNGDKNE